MADNKASSSGALNSVANAFNGWLNTKQTPAPSPAAQEDAQAQPCPTCGQAPSMATDVKKSFNQKLNMSDNDADDKSK